MRKLDFLDIHFMRIWHSQYFLSLSRVSTVYKINARNYIALSGVYNNCGLQPDVLLACVILSHWCNMRVHITSWSDERKKSYTTLVLSWAEYCSWVEDHYRGCGIINPWQYEGILKFKSLKYLCFPPPPSQTLKQPTCQIMLMCGLYRVKHSRWFSVLRVRTGIRDPAILSFFTIDEYLSVGCVYTNTICYE